MEPAIRRPQCACRSSWARLIAKVYEVDPLICTRCGPGMKLIAVITDPAQVSKILRHVAKIGRAPLGLDPGAGLADSSPHRNEPRRRPEKLILSSRTPFRESLVLMRFGSASDRD